MKNDLGLDPYLPPFKDKVLDKSFILPRLNHIDDLADSSLQELIKQIPEYLLEFNTQLDSQSLNLSSLHECIHTLKGALYYIGAPLLHQRVFPLSDNFSQFSEQDIREEVAFIVEQLESILQMKTYPD